MKKTALKNLKLTLSKKTISNLASVKGGLAGVTNAGGHGTCCMSCVNWTKGDSCNSSSAAPSPHDGNDRV